MAHYARLGVNNVVVRVDIIDNSKITTSGGIEKDALAFEHLYDEFGEKIYVSFKPNSMFGSDRNESDELVDKDGHLLPYGDIEKLKRTRFFVLLLDEVKYLSYS